MPKSGVPAYSYLRLGKRFIENIYAPSLICLSVASYDTAHCSLWTLPFLLCNYVSAGSYLRLWKRFKALQKRFMSTFALPIATYVLANVSDPFRKNNVLKHVCLRLLLGR